MEQKAKEFLYRCLSTPSPTGFEAPIQSVVKEYVASFCKHVEVDYHGNLIAAINPNAKRKVMFAGHCDQIGFMVKHISNDGYVYLAPLGGIDNGVLQGAKVTIHTAKGRVSGLFGRKPIHLQRNEDKGTPELDKLWIDIGSKTKKDAEKRISIGDPVTFSLEITELSSDLISSPGLDNKVGLFVVIEALRLLSKEKSEIGVFAVSTVQEEVGLRGARTSAFSIDPEVGIAVDVTHANDNPGHDGKNETPCVLGGGPVIPKGPNINPVVETLLKAAAKKGKVPFQPAINSKLLGNDANAIQVSRGGVAAGTLGIPNRYMHTQAEVCSLSDLSNAAKLLSLFVKSISSKTDFRPA